MWNCLNIIIWKHDYVYVISTLKKHISLHSLQFKYFLRSNESNVSKHKRCFRSRRYFGSSLLTSVCIWIKDRFHMFTQGCAVERISRVFTCSHRSHGKPWHLRWNRQTELSCWATNSHKTMKSLSNLDVFEEHDEKSGNLLWTRQPEIVLLWFSVLQSNQFVKGLYLTWESLYATFTAIHLRVIPCAFHSTTFTSHPIINI